MSELTNLQQFRHGDLSQSSIVLDLVNRMNLWPKIYRRYVEEEILSVVPISDEFVSSSIAAFLGDRSLEDMLADKGWTKSDLVIHVSLPEALRLFSDFL